MLLKYWTISASVAVVLSTGGANASTIRSVGTIPQNDASSATTSTTTIMDHQMAFSDEDRDKLTQKSDPCLADNAYFRLFGQYDVMKPSFFTECASSLKINPDAMKLHIESLNEIFKQYHCFYDIAKDPDASFGWFQPELGHTLYGEGGGQVDIDAELNAIVDDIDMNGASMANFWQINTVFNKLHDGHVLLPTVEQGFYDYIFTVVPERFVGEEFNLLMPRFYLDDNQNLQLTIATQVPANIGPIEVKDVTAINGQSVEEYMTYLANSPELNIAYQDLGARVNYLIENFALFGGFYTGFMGSGTPSNLLPDDFLVTYADGTSETYLVGAIASAPFYSWASTSGLVPGLVSIDRSVAESFINQPGEQFDAYQRAAQRLTDLGGLRRRMRTNTASKVEQVKRLNFITEDSNNNLKRNLQAANPVPSFIMSIPDKGGFLIEDDHIVMKLSSFQVGLDEITQLWTDIVNAAKQNGITKLLIDISGNGGGSVAAGLVIMLHMFPSVDFQWFSDQWDINYNTPMREYVEALVPLLEIVMEQMIDLPANTFVTHVDSFTYETFERYEAAGDGILELCNDAVNPFDPSPVTSATQCRQASLLHANITNFVADPDIATYFDLMLSLLETIIEYNPWAVVLEQVELLDSDIMSDLMQAGVHTAFRGGVKSNFTAKFDLLGNYNQLIYDQTTTLNAALDYTFDEYVFLSDGVSGSMAAIFPFEASQLYKNRDRSGVQTKVTLAAYGGLGNMDDFSVSSFPASVQGVHLEDPIIGDAAIQLFAGLFPSNLDGFDEAIQQMLEYSQSVAIPPFFGDTLPVMPVSAYYSVFMEHDALPLQYIKTPLDGYIPKIFSWVSFEQPDDLPLLYSSASYFFSDANTDILAPVETRGITPASVGSKEPLVNTPIGAPGTEIPEEKSGSFASFQNDQFFAAGLAAIASLVHFLLL